jgi:diadenosine tetraphosphate (Ap4A) HIT family hydrolase
LRSSCRRPAHAWGSRAIPGCGANLQRLALPAATGSEVDSTPPVCSRLGRLMRDRTKPRPLLDENLVHRIRVALQHQADGGDIDLSTEDSYSSSKVDCVFCCLTLENCVALHASARTVTILDRTPVTLGHCLVISRRHVSSMDALTESELAELFTQARHVAQVVLREVYLTRRVSDASRLTFSERMSAREPTEEPVTRVEASVSSQERFGYNIGVNNGRCAGQSVPHVHVHVIPRAPGDGFWCTHRPWGMELAKRRLKMHRHRL